MYCQHRLIGQAYLKFYQMRFVLGLPTLSECFPWMKQLEVILDDGTEGNEAKGMNASQSLVLINASYPFVGHKFPQTR